MSGNVCEWCWDWKDYNYYKKSPGANPTGPFSGTARILHGGSWNNLPLNARAAVRDYLSKPYYRGFYYGFRLVRTF